MRKSHLKQMLAALLLLCSTVASATTYDDWTSTNKDGGSTSSNTYFIEATAGEVLYFYCEVSSEENFDWLTVTINGEEFLKISGEKSGFYQYSFTADGTYTLEVAYTKDGSVDNGYDQGRIYNIEVSESGNAPSGTCGYDATWNFVNGMLTISGTGEMDGYNLYSDNQPWNFYKSDITSVVVEEGITSIGDHAFFNFDYLTSVTLPTSLTNIGTRAFDESGLASIYIPANVAIIGESAFGTCNSVESIIVDENNYVFDSRNNCNAIIETSTNTLVAGCRNTIIPSDITNIASYAFAGCHNIESITIPEGVTSIGQETFSNCYNLTTLNIPESVTSIGDYAFANCYSLTSITSLILAENLFAINSNVLGVDKNYCTLYVPAGASATYAATDGWSEFTNIVELEAPGITGICGDNANWSLVNGVLTISGTGNMYNSQEACAPWFDYRNEITTVVIEDGVTSIGAWAFYSCDAFESIIIPSSVTSIGEAAFYSCDALESITIPSSVTSIGENPFLYCDKLASINVANENTKYDSRENCNAIIETATNTLITGCKNTTIPEGVTAIGNSSFQGCDFTSFNIPEGVTSIEEDAFFDCVFLESITLSNSVTSIGKSAFSNNQSLNSIIIPNSVISIGERAFSCSGLESATIGDGVTSIGEGAFSSCGNLANIDIANENTKYDSRENCNAIIETATNTLITGCKNTIIPNSVTSIGERAFDNWKDITSITIPSNVASIGNYAFLDCTNLTCIASLIPANRLFAINSNLFSDNIKTTSVLLIPTGAKETYATTEGWSEFTNIIEVEPETLEMPGIKGICGDSLIWNLYNGVLTISGSGEMSNYSYDNRSPWNKYAANINTVVIEDGVCSIGGYAFYGCDALESITLPNSLTSIGNYAFYYCSSLESITLPEGVTSIGWSAFSSCSSLVNITLPNSVTSIGSSAFSSCSSLVNIKLPEGLTNIESRIFYNCSSLASVTIPAGVTSIKKDAFERCYALTSVTSLIPANNLFAINSGVFNYAITLYVPAGASATYAATEGWNEFTNIVELEGEGSLEPVYFDSADGMPGTMTNSHHIWESSLINCDGKINGVRITVFATTGGNNTYNGYPMVTLGELEFYDANGNKIEYTADDITTNSLETSEGSLDALRDGAYSTFYHSKWQTGTTPNDYVYLDVNFPRSVDSFTIKIVGRNTQNPFTPTSIGVTKAGDYCPKRKSTSGSCGNSATWSYADGTLTISGTGAMTNYTSLSAVPWDEYDNEIQTIVIAEGITSISQDAFNGCTELANLTLPSTINQIGMGAFSGCESLTSVVVPEGVTNLLYQVFNSCSSLTDVTLPSTLTTISWGAFSECSSLVNLSIPANVTEIGHYAFDLCTSLENVTIPEGVTSIGEYVFKNCSSITSITSLIPAESLFAVNSNAFEGMNKSACTLYVPFDAKETYASTEGWSELTNISSIKFGKCGDNATWSLVDSVLTITGTGAMYDYEGNGTPWNDYRTNEIKSVVVSEGITRIGNSAFRGFEVVESISLPQGITSIGDRAFSGCAVAEVTIPSTVTTIENYAFYLCTNVTSINIPNSVISIGDTTFGNCSSLESVTIGNSVTSIGDNTFNNCSSLASVTIGNSVTSIGEAAFHDCISLESVVIPEGATSIGAEAFRGCTNLVSLTIPSSIETIGSFSYSGCTKLEAIYISDLSAWCRIEFATGNPNPLNMGHNLYLNNELITDLVIPEDIDTIKFCTFEGASINSITFHEGVTFIDGYAFAHCENLTNVTIPESVTSIGDYAFYGCSSLENITSHIPAESLFAINSNVFQGVDKSTCTLYVPAGAKETYAATEGWSEFTNIVEIPYGKCGDNATWNINEGVLTISGTGDMYDYDSNDRPWYDYYLEITSVVIESGITSVGDYAFEGCDGLTSIEIPNSVTSVGDWAFTNCGGLTSIEIPNSVTSVGDYAFGSCFNLTSIEIPNSVTSIGYYAFCNCSDLTSIVVKEGNTVYDSRNNCNAIIETATNALVTGCKNTIIPDGITSIGDWAFSGCYRLTSIEIPNSVTSIGNGAFNACDGLTSIEIPNSVTSIGKSAFSYCSGLTSIEIPNSVTSIEGYAFSYCSGLTSVKSYILAENLFAINSDVFWDVDKEACTLYVPAGAKETYAATEGWSEFTNIVEIPYGKCGDNATWELADSTLTISGTGDMYDYNYETKPWYNYQNEVTSIVIESGITGIGESAFYGCENTASIIIPEGVTTIGEYAFDACRKLTSLELPASLRYIGKITSTNLTSIVVKEGNTVYDSRNNCNAVIETATNTLVIGCKTTIIPDGITSIGDYAFFYRYGLTGINIPESVTSIGEAAFQGCYDLESITIPAGVTFIGEWAFTSCEGLTSFTSLIPAEYLFDFDYNAFYDICCRLYVPAGAKEAYEESYGWQYFTHTGIVELAAEDFKLTVGSAGYATLYLSHEVARPRGVKAYYISEIKNDYAVLEGLWDEIPAKTAVIIQAAPGTYTFKESTYNIAPVTNNLLCGTPIDKEIPAAANTTYYALGRSNGVVGLYRALIEDGVYFNNANKAYLPLAEAQQSARVSFRFPDGSTTDIESIFGGENDEVVYDLSGRRINEIKERGVYIINGKKVVR